MSCFLRRHYIALSGVGFSLLPLAANAQATFPTVTISWSSAGAAAAPVPTLGTYAIVSLAILLAVLAVKVLKNHHRQVALALIGCLTASALFHYPVSEAQDPGPYATGCEGQITRRDNRYDQRLQNTCSSPIEVAYEWESCPVEFTSCVAPLPSEEFLADSECVADGGQMQPGEIKAQLVCDPGS